MFSIVPGVWNWKPIPDMHIDLGCIATFNYMHAKRSYSGEYFWRIVETIRRVF